MQAATLKKIGFTILMMAFVGIFSTQVFALEDYDRQALSLAAYTMGVIHDLEGETNEAIQQYEKSLVYRDNYASHLRVGANYARVGRLEDALDELQKVLEVEPDNIQARYLLALIYSTQKKFDQAAGEYESILKSVSKAEPENIEIYGYLGQLYYSLKQYDKAINQYEMILSLRPKNPDVMFLLGSLYLEVGKRKEAATLFNRAIKVDPNHDISLNSLGYTYAEDGIKLEEAQDLIERALSIDPENGAYLDSLGWVYYQKGQYAMALEYLMKADRYLKDPIIYEHLGDVYSKMEDSGSAKRFWQQSLDLLPNQSHLQEKIEAIGK